MEGKSSFLFLNGLFGAISIRQTEISIKANIVNVENVFKP